MKPQLGFTVATTDKEQAHAYRIQIYKGAGSGCTYAASTVLCIYQQLFSLCIMLLLFYFYCYERLSKTLRFYRKAKRKNVRWVSIKLLSTSAWEDSAGQHQARPGRRRARNVVEQI